MYVQSDVQSYVIFFKLYLQIILSLVAILLLDLIINFNVQIVLINSGLIYIFVSYSKNRYAKYASLSVGYVTLSTILSS